MGQTNWHHQEDCIIVAETEKAFLICIEDEELWIPKSQIHKDCLEGDSALKVGDIDATVTMTEWIAEQKGII